MKSKNLFYYLAITIGTSSLLYRSFQLIKKKFFLKRKVYLNGLSCSFPLNCYSQDEMKEMFIENYCGGKENLLEKDFDFIQRVFQASCIDTSYVNLSKNNLFKRMKREEYTNYVKQTLIEISCKSAKNAIENCLHLNSNEITHIIFGTMTGTIAAPSMDIHLVKELQLNSNIKRLNVESMGCLTGFRLIGLCNDIALQDENNIVLLIVSDIRSALGNQLTPFESNQPIDKSNVIISALFRDSSGAAIFSQKAIFSNELSYCHILKHQSTIIPDTIELGRLKEFNDSSIHLYLDKQLPYAVFDALPNFVSKLLNEYQIDIYHCQFAVHTGGPKIIRGIKECLNLDDEQLCSSWYVMTHYGNLSGSSNLVVLEHFCRWKYSENKPNEKGICFPKDFNRYKYIVGLSFGPGIAVEGVLFQLE
ncbi:unnamed protein product [Adineta ricciae]|uniref:Chalcone synthase n=1 Tax=Adineta ricciae TaxID=249248 RepID=A0A815KGW5_ADIRI|nr:unnamed protein product [Adineta ricciae]CAF1396071.1 unnamed protein product [Adineta ricciae]